MNILFKALAVVGGLNARVITLGRRVRPIEIDAPWLVGAHAVTVWPFIFYRDERTVGLVAHEHFHWDDQARIGLILWLPVYLAFEAARRVLNIVRKFYGAERLPFWWHPLERKAYLAQWVIEKNPDMLMLLRDMNRRDILDDVVEAIFNFYEDNGWSDEEGEDASTA